MSTTATSSPTASTTAGSSAAAAAAIANATKASGVVVKLDAEGLRSLLDRVDRPLIVHAEGGFFSTHHRYLTSYKGLAFYAKFDERLTLPAGAEVVEAGEIWTPG